MSTNVVAWSGGFDSTYLLLHLLETTDDPLLVISNNHRLTGPAKCDRERSVRNRIIDYIKFKYPDKDIQYVELDVTLNSEAYHLTSNNVGLAQPIFWICSMIPLLPDDSLIHFGYINSDDATKYFSDLVSSIEYLSKIQRKTVKVYLPMMYMSKSDVLTLMMDNFPDMLDVCTSCENPKHYDKCCECLPCKHMIEALLYLSTIDKYKDKAKRMLKDYYRLNVNIDTIEKVMPEKPTEEDCEQIEDEEGI